MVATTRFPMDAARRFAAQPGSDEWAGRLHVVGADFRDLRGLEAMYAAVGLGLGLGLGIGLGLGLGLGLGFRRCRHAPSSKT